MSYVFNLLCFGVILVGINVRRQLATGLILNEAFILFCISLNIGFKHNSIVKFQWHKTSHKAKNSHINFFLIFNVV